MTRAADPLQCTFDDAERNHLREGIRMSVRAKIEFFEEMLELAWRSGAAQRAARRDAEQGPEAWQGPE